jgi:hypothetical protein
MVTSQNARPGLQYWLVSPSFLATTLLPEQAKPSRSIRRRWKARPVLGVTQGKICIGQYLSRAPCQGASSSLRETNGVGEILSRVVDHGCKDGDISSFLFGSLLQMHRRSRHIHDLILIRLSWMARRGKDNALLAGQDLHGLAVSFYTSNIFKPSLHR